MKTIHDFLPKFVLPEWRISNDKKRITIGLVDVRDKQEPRGYMDCEVFTVNPNSDMALLKVEKLSKDYFDMLFDYGVLSREEN